MKFFCHVDNVMPHYKRRKILTNISDISQHIAMSNNQEYLSISLRCGIIITSFVYKC